MIDILDKFALQAGPVPDGFESPFAERPEFQNPPHNPPEGASEEELDLYYNVWLSENSRLLQLWKVEVWKPYCDEYQKKRLIEWPYFYAAMIMLERQKAIKMLGEAIQDGGES